MVSFLPGWVWQSGFPRRGRAPVLVKTVPPLDFTVVPFLFVRGPDSTIVEIAPGHGSGGAGARNALGCVHAAADFRVQT